MIKVIQTPEIPNNQMPIDMNGQSSRNIGGGDISVKAKTNNGALGRRIVPSKTPLNMLY